MFDKVYKTQSEGFDKNYLHYVEELKDHKIRDRMSYFDIQRHENRIGGIIDNITFNHDVKTDFESGTYFTSIEM